MLCGHLKWIGHADGKMASQILLARNMMSDKHGMMP